MTDSTTFLARSAACVLLAVPCAGVGCAQAPPSQPAAQQAQPPPPPQAARGGPAKKVGMAEAHYSRLSGLTEAMLMPPPVVSSGGQGDTLTMSPYFSVPGDVLKRPERVYFLFLSQSRYLQFTDLRKITVSGDGEEFISGDASLLRADCREGDSCVEVLQSPPLAYEKFLSLMRAKRISVRLGPANFGLRPEDVESFRDLTRLVDR